MDYSDQQAFDLGWDHASFGMSVPEDANKMFCDGYRAFCSGGTRKASRPDKFVRKWLQIRYGALRRGKFFSPEVTPQYLEKITPASGKCPVTEETFTFGQNKSTDWSVDRANNNRGYVCGNVIIIGQRVNGAKGDKSLEEIERLARRNSDTDGFTPGQWRKLARLIEPAFGEHVDSVSPVPVLFGQPVALGMPVSPLAGFQVALSTALIEGWNLEKRSFMAAYVGEMNSFVCKSRSQKRAFDRLVREVLRRSNHIQNYAEVWATPRIQKRLWSFVNTLGGAGLYRLVRLQEITVGKQNTKIE